MAWVLGLATFTVGAAVLAWFWAQRRNEYFDADGNSVKRWKAPQLAADAARNTPPNGIDASFYQVLNRYEVRATDVAALIIDLARRGYLRIEQDAKPDARGRGGEWSLNRHRVAKEKAGELHTFERVLLRRLFAEKEAVRVNALRRSFGPNFVAVQNEIYQHVTERGLFRDEPLDVKVAWRRRSSGLIIAAAFAWVLLQPLMPYPGSIALGVLALGITAAVLSNFVGGRTAAGSAAALEGAEFARFLKFGTPPLTADQRPGVFARYLPYALVLGVEEEWAAACDELGDPAVMAGVLGWYRVPAWTIAERSEVCAADFTAAVRVFYAHTARVIGSSKAEPQRKG